MDNRSSLYEFGAFRLNVAERLLLRESEVVQLPPKAFEVLLALVEHHGHLLEKEVLLKTVWPDSFVEENNLADNISRLRKALRDGEHGQKFIETVPKRGYRFIASVKELDGESAASVADSAAGHLSAHSAPIGLYKRPAVLVGVFGLLVLTLASVGVYRQINSAPLVGSLAVLPFSSDPQAEYLSDGITESLINDLSSLSNLRVTARSIAFSYKGKEVIPRQVGQELKVGSVLTGRVALRNDTLTVQVDLVDATKGTQDVGRTLRAQAVGHLFRAGGDRQANHRKAPPQTQR